VGRFAVVLCNFDAQSVHSLLSGGLNSSLLNLSRGEAREGLEESLAAGAAAAPAGPAGRSIGSGFPAPPWSVGVLVQKFTDERPGRSVPLRYFCEGNWAVSK
jgi:hypothetical protein